MKVNVTGFKSSFNHAVELKPKTKSTKTKLKNILRFLKNICLWVFISIGTELTYCIGFYAFIFIHTQIDR